MTVNEPMKLWDAVAKTNPKYTKKVKLGREFTAIDPHSQIKEATKMFGPAGIGWGWEVDRVEYLPTNQIAILIKLWHGEKKNTIEQWGQAGLYIDKADSRKDQDCFKKATTDGLTKCLSYLGFNADVFLGQFDDSKYVAQVAAEFDAKDKAEDPKRKGMQDKADVIIRNIEEAKTLEELEAVKDRSRETVTEIREFDKLMGQKIASAAAKAMAAFPETEKAA